jgi:hypothetical protein
LISQIYLRINLKFEFFQKNNIDLNIFNPEYNILPNTDNFLSFKYSEETKIKINDENNLMFERIHIVKLLTKMSEI